MKRKESVEDIAHCICMMLKHSQIILDIDNMEKVPKWLKNPLKDFAKVPKEFNDLVSRFNATESQQFVYVSYTMALVQCFEEFNLEYETIDEGLIQTIYITAKSLCNDYAKIEADIFETHKINKQSERLVNVIERHYNVNRDSISYGVVFLDNLHKSLNIKIKEQ